MYIAKEINVQMKQSFDNDVTIFIESTKFKKKLNVTSTFFKHSHFSFSKFLFVVQATEYIYLLFSYLIYLQLLDFQEH